MRKLDVVLLICVSLVGAPSAWAALGGNVASIQADAALMNASLRVDHTGKFSVYELQAPSGTVVREYMSPAGIVFAVSWEGPFLPDLRQLLGKYFERYTSTVNVTHAGLNARAVHHPDLVARSSGHARAVHGKAFAPALAPLGVSIDDVQ